MGLAATHEKKERYIKEGLRYRIQLFSAILAIKGKTPVDVSKVTITITRNLPEKPRGAGSGNRKSLWHMQQ